MSQPQEEDNSGDKRQNRRRAGGGGGAAKREKQLSSEHTNGTPVGNVKGGHKNDPFYIAKRTLIRKADALGKKFQANVFIAIHQKESDKIYTFTNDNNYSLERVSDLIRRDVCSGAFLKKNRAFEETDFQHVKQNIKVIEKIYPNFPGTQ